MGPNVHRQRLVRLRQLRKQGRGLAECAQVLGISLDAVVRLDADRRKGRTPGGIVKQIRRRLDRNQSWRRIARALEVNVSVVRRVAGGGEKGTTRLKTAIRCPKCGAKIIELPCRVCAAKGAESD